MPISSCKATLSYDCRGFPTITVTIVTQNGTFRAEVPNAELGGKHETLDLKDRDPAHWHGRGVLTAVDYVNTKLAPAIVGKPDLDESNQDAMDKILLAIDGTENKSMIGANSILGVSMAVCRAGASKKALPLFKHIAGLYGGNKILSVPIPAFDVVNGGRLSGNNLAFQEFQLIPTGSRNFAEAMQMGTEIYHDLGNQVAQKYGQYACYVGTDGGYGVSPKSDIEEVLRMMQTSIEHCGYEGRCFIGINAAATQMYKNGLYDLDFKNPKSNPRGYINGDLLNELYYSLILKYPIISIADPFEQDKWDDWNKMTTGWAFRRNIQIAGDFLLTTNAKRVEKAVEKSACNCMTVKLNQIGTVTEALEACKVAQRAGWGCIVSHRGGDTCDAFIADLAVGIGAGQIKCGAPCRSEHVAKYNQLLRIESELGPKYSRYGRGCFKSLKKD